jgi:hypothetical protein
MSQRVETVLERFERAADWTIFGNDTDNLDVSTICVEGKYAITFDKVDGAADKTYAGAARTVALSIAESPSDYFVWSLYLSSITNVAYAWIRLGTDATNYLEWRYDDSKLVVGWSRCYAMLGKPSASAGTGCNFKAVTYLDFGVSFDAAGNTLAGMLIDDLCIFPGASATLDANLALEVQRVSNEAAAEELQQVGGVANAAAVTFDEGDSAALSLDLKGGLRTKVDLAQVAKDGTSPADVLQVGGISTTAAPTYTTAKTNALSLTTGGALRARVETAQTTIGGDAAADVVQVGTATTTAAPTYTTAKQNPLSTDTGGSLRTRVDKAQTTIGGDAAADVVQVGTATTTAAPTYTTAKQNPLSTDTSGGLRTRVDLAQGAPAATAPAQRVLTGAIAETTFPTAVADGQTVSPLYDEYGRTPSDRAHDFSSSSQLVTPVADMPRAQFGPQAFTALSAAGSTAVTEVTGLSCWEWQVAVASLEAGQFCGVKVECSADNASWANADDTGAETIFNADGAYLLRATGRCSKYTRLTLSTDSVGGAVTVTGTLTAAR